MRVPAVRWIAAARRCKGTGWMEILGSGMVHPARARGRRRRQRALHRLGIRHGPGAHRDAALRHSRHSAFSTTRTCASSSRSRDERLVRVAARVRPVRRRRRRELRDLLTAHVATVEELVALRADLATIVDRRASSRQRRIRTPITSGHEGGRRQRRAARRRVRRAERHRRQALSVRARRRDAAGRPEDREAQDPRRRRRTACSARRASSGSARTTRASWSSTSTPRRERRSSSAMPVGDMRLVHRRRCRIAPICCRTSGSRARSPPSTGEHVSACRRSGASSRRHPERTRSRRQRATPAASTVRLEDTTARARYMGVVIRGVKVGPSPDWLVRAARSRSARARSTTSSTRRNYMLHELGQPMHAFDLAKLARDRRSWCAARRAAKS